MRRIAKLPEARMVFFSFTLNLIWETLQSHLFLFNYWLGSFALCMIYCASADVLIIAGLFGSVALLYNERYWFLKPTAQQITVLLVLSLIVNVSIEYVNVYVTKKWAYGSGMPTVFGIGLLPALQWIIIPSLILFILHQRSK
jgi:hypothetical protein